MPPGTCECAGDPHCKTFDDYRMDYQGTCEFLLVMFNSTTDSVPFAVYAGNVALNAYVSAVRYVEIVYNNSVVHIERTTVLVSSSIIIRAGMYISSNMDEYGI